MVWPIKLMNIEQGVPFFRVWQGGAIHSTLHVKRIAPPWIGLPLKQIDCMLLTTAPTRTQSQSPPPGSLPPPPPPPHPPHARKFLDETIELHVYGSFSIKILECLDDARATIQVYANTERACS